MGSTFEEYHVYALNFRYCFGDYVYDLRQCILFCSSTTSRFWNVFVMWLYVWPLLFFTFKFILHNCTLFLWWLLFSEVLCIIRIMEVPVGCMLYLLPNLESYEIWYLIHVILFKSCWIIVERLLKYIIFISSHQNLLFL